MALPPPVLSQTGATTVPDLEAEIGDLVGVVSDAGVVSIDIEMGVVEEEVDAVEGGARDLAAGGEFEHFFQRNGGLGGVGFFSDEARPHGVV